MTRPIRAHHRTLAAMVTAVMVMASCSGDDDEAGADEETTTTTAVETTAPPTTLSVEQEVEAAYHEWDAVMAELGPEPNPDDPRLPELVLEPQLTEIRDSLADAVATNQVYEISPESTYEITSTTVAATGETATLIICAIGDDRVIDRDTGNVVHDATYTLEDEASFRNHNGQWMLENYRNLNSWEGITSCAS